MGQTSRGGSSRRCSYRFRYGYGESKCNNIRNNNYRCVGLCRTSECPETTKRYTKQSCTQCQSNITLCIVSVGVIYQAMTRVCEGGQPAWQNLDLLGNSCHLDTWLMLMTSAIVADSKQQVNYKNRFDNDSGTFNRCLYSNYFQVHCFYCSKTWVSYIRFTPHVEYCM